MAPRTATVLYRGAFQSWEEYVDRLADQAHDDRITYLAKLQEGGSRETLSEEEMIG